MKVSKLCLMLCFYFVQQKSELPEKIVVICEMRGHLGMKSCVIVVVLFKDETESREFESCSIS